jgi:4-diphosphocytidyl-2-C-methyl-D-erythritol kinase
VRVRAFAKINLSLRIVGTRSDGYHELLTIFQSLALHDTLTIRRTRSAFHLTCDDDRVPVDGSNVIVRAAEAMWRAAQRRGKPQHVSVHLTKRIPLQAGLGGGSSDAAAALVAFGRMWRVDARRLHAIASTIGADVPYFLEGGTVLGLGRGEELYPLMDRPAAWVVLALPDFGVSTREAYEWFDAEAARGHDRERVGRSNGELHNDLQGAVATRHPDISRLVARLRRLGASHAAMTGSGSAVFGLFESRRAAAEAAGRMSPSACPQALVTRTLTRSAYRRLGPFAQA